MTTPAIPPVRSVVDRQAAYAEMMQRLEDGDLMLTDLSKWLPSLARFARPMLPGEMVLLIGDTGTGKSGVGLNIAQIMRPHGVLLFNMELPECVVFEREMALIHNKDCRVVEEHYRHGEKLRTGPSDHIYTVTMSGLDVAKMDAALEYQRQHGDCDPEIVIVDYIQLMRGAGGSRYEKISAAAEGLKAWAVNQNIVVIAISQIHRKGESYQTEVHLHDAKDSGSLENSAQLVLTMWRDAEDSTLIMLSVEKCSRGRTGRIPCNFDGNTMRVTERASWGE